ncbi:MAG: pantetheine-phosphate adenylyltransferase, partial [Bacteroidales bacterium]|nr:pantetheine-phosphate adenylyltransferase [Bacteroidales bacterium]
MERIAVFPGSFDPVTIGHEQLVRRALPLFDKLIVAIGDNSEKRTWLSVAERRALLETLFSGEPKVEVAAYTGLTTDFCRTCGARFLVRGLRTALDFEYEKTIAAVNRQLDNGIESVFLYAADELSSVQSSVVREMLKYGKPADWMV